MLFHGHSRVPPVPRTMPSALTAAGGSTRPTTVRHAHTGRVSKKSKATVAGIKSFGTHWSSGQVHGGIPWNWWKVTIATWRTHGSLSIWGAWSIWGARSIWGGSTSRVCSFTSSSIAKATVASPACTGYNNHGRDSHQKEDKIVTRMFNVQLELQRFDLDEARPKTRL